MKINKKILWAAIAVAVILCGVGGFFVIRYYLDNKTAGFKQEYVLYVSPEMTAQQVTDSLCSVAIRPGSVRRSASRENLAERIHPGKYLIKPEHQAVYAVRMVCHGWQTPHKMTLSGTIRTKGAIATKISSQMMVDSLDVAMALEDSTFLAKYGFTTENVFAMILKDTYEMYWTADIEEIFDRLKKEYDAFWTPERKTAASDLGLSPMQVSVMASIVSGETLKEFEYPIIAGVYLNRYRKGMKLQADPTIAYCYDYTLDRILKPHLNIDSPYNTYKYVGLPPAPINSPSKECIDSVLHAQQHNYIYFCASPEFNGTHRFARSYSDHLKNAREFHRALQARRTAQGL